MKVINVLKVIDVDVKSVNLSTWNYLLNFFRAYEDLKLKEHLINIEDALEDIESKEGFLIGSIRDSAARKIVKNEVIKLKTLCDENDAAYIRFVN